MKHFNLLKSLLLLCALIVGSLSGWADEKELTFVVSSNPGGWPTTNSTTLTNYSYTLNDVDYTFALKNVKCNSGYLMFTNPAVLGLPAIDGYKLTKVVASNSSGCSTSTKVGISSSSSSESYITGGAIQTWSKTNSTYTYNLSSTKGDTMYYLYVTNKNAQLTQLKLTYEETVPTTVSTPSISGDGVFLTSTEVSISCGTNDASIYFTTDGSTPTTSSTLYKAPFSLTSTATVKAIAIKSGLTNSSVAEKTFTKIIPLTVQEALTAINGLDDNGSLDNQYVRGIVSTAAAAVENGQMTYSISTDGTKEDELKVYKGKGLNNTNFSAASDLEVGDQVVICGQLMKYVNNNTVTPEFNSGNYLMSLVEIQDNDLAMIGTINLSMAEPTTTADAKDYVSTSSNGAFSYSDYDEAVCTVSAEGIVTPVAAGSTTITVSQARTSMYKEGSVTIPVVVAAASLNVTEIVIDPVNGNTTLGTPKEVDYLISDTYDGTVTVTSSNTSVATVSIIQPVNGEGTLTINPVAVGSAVITVSAPVTVASEAAEDVAYMITVSGPIGQTTALTNVNETTTFTDKNLSHATGEVDWACSNPSYAISLESSGDARGVQFGTNKGAFTLTATNSSQVSKVSLVMSTNGTGNTISVSVGETAFKTVYGGSTASETLTLTSGMKNGTVDFVGSGIGNIVISINDKNKSVYIKSIHFENIITTKLNAYGYATFCSEYPLDFSEATDYTAWQVKGTSDSEITFEKITGSVKGGTGIFLMGEANATVTLKSADSDNVLSSNMLTGTLAPTYVTTVNGDYTNFGLSGDKFVKINNGTVKANKAYLPILTSNVPGTGARLSLVFENETDGIETINKAQMTNDSYFDLQGRKVAQPTKGLYIVNGKKVVKK